MALIAGRLTGCGGVELEDAEQSLDTNLVGQSGCTCGGARVNRGNKVGRPRRAHRAAAVSVIRPACAVPATP
ncbi:hypothetical protein MVI01_16030 [Myxococcus virescens]|uniref:Uncharacterized protein n=1 Tax=Myxococcus virescens TaxID=83456 RepID=A0A511HB08_9BACT|nr:hypothetical protein MVI01_16030 [Myxococcus virescens]